MGDTYSWLNFCFLQEVKKKIYLSGGTDQILFLTFLPFSANIKSYIHHSYA